MTASESSRYAEVRAAKARQAARLALLKRLWLERQAKSSRAVTPLEGSLKTRDRPRTL